ncbi:hypothetical protein EMCRGX_G002265 [Ephydatia muelleri]
MALDFLPCPRSFYYAATCKVVCSLAPSCRYHLRSIRLFSRRQFLSDLYLYSYTEWINPVGWPTFNIHHCSKNGEGHQGTQDYTMTIPLLHTTVPSFPSLSPPPHHIMLSWQIVFPPTTLKVFPPPPNLVVCQQFRFQAQWGPPGMGQGLDPP